MIAFLWIALGIFVAAPLAVAFINLRTEESLMTGIRWVPWSEWWRRFRAHGFAWRRFP